MLEDDLAESSPQSGRSRCRAIAGRGEQSGSLASKAEGARHEPAADVLAGLAGDRQLEVVDRRRAVQGKPGQDSAVDPIDEIDTAAGLDDVTAQRRDDRAAGGEGANDRIAQAPEGIGTQDPGQRIEPVCKPGLSRQRAALGGKRHLAGPLVKRLVAQGEEVKRRRGGCLLMFDRSVAAHANSFSRA